MNELLFNDASPSNYMLSRRPYPLTVALEFRQV